MTAYNIVRFRVKPGMQREFEKRNAEFDRQMTGFRKGALVKTGGTTYCFIGEWDSFDDLANARTILIGNLDRFRDLLEDLGGGLGVTYAVSGEAVVEVIPPSKTQKVTE